MAETKQLHALSNIYLEAVYGGAKKEAPKDNRLTVTAADKKANTKAYQNYKAGNKAYKAADHLKTEDAKYGYDKDGKSLNPKDDPHRGQGEKIQKRTKAWMDKKGQKGAPGLDAMKARTAEHKAKRGVKEDKAFEYVKKQIAAKYGKSGYVSKDNPRKPQTDAEKAKARAHQAKVDKENAAERAKDPSQGRYPKG